MIEAAEKQSGRFKWGDSKQLGDQALEICAALDSLMEKYLDFMKESGLFDMENEDPSVKKMLDLYGEMIILIKHCEMWTIDYSTCMDRMDHKISLILRKLEERDDLK